MIRWVYFVSSAWAWVMNYGSWRNVVRSSIPMRVIEVRARLWHQPRALVLNLFSLHFHHISLRPRHGVKLHQEALSGPPESTTVCHQTHASPLIRGVTTILRHSMIPVYKFESLAFPYSLPVAALPTLITSAWKKFHCNMESFSVLVSASAAYAAGRTS